MGEQATLRLDDGNGSSSVCVHGVALMAPTGAPLRIRHSLSAAEKTSTLGKAMTSGPVGGETIVGCSPD